MSRLVSLVRARTDLIFQSIRLPERFRGTIVENWARYWKGLVRDYTDAFKETVVSAKQTPVKTAFYFALCAAGVTAVKKNPRDFMYSARVVEAKDELGLVAQEVRNVASYDYLNNLEKLFNENRMRHVSLGLFSLYWTADESASLALPKAQCEFMKPAWITWHERIVEVAFWDRFWALEKHLKDFDVNPSEWK